MLKSIHHINIVVTDLEKTIKFFRNFGFTVSSKKTLAGEWLDRVTGLKDVRASYVSLQHQNSPLTLELLQYRHPEGEIDSRLSVPNRAGFRHLAFEVEDISKEVKLLRQNGVEFFSGIQTNPYGKKMCYFTGPDGILLELLEL